MNAKPKYHVTVLSEVAPRPAVNPSDGWQEGVEMSVWYDRSQRCWVGCLNIVPAGERVAYESEDVVGSTREEVETALRELNQAEDESEPEMEEMAF